MTEPAVAYAVVTANELEDLIIAHSYPWLAKGHIGEGWVIIQVRTGNLEISF